MDYKSKIASLQSPSFDEIRRIALSEISHFTNEEHTHYYNQLKRGTALIETHEQLCAYLRSFGKMHKAKLIDSIKQLPQELLGHPFEIVDWGCGQAMGTVNLYDFLNDQGKGSNIRKVTLIEPSRVALERAKIHVSAYVDEPDNLVCLSEFFENIETSQISSDSGLPVIHIFSNILDVEQIDLRHLSRLIDSSVNTENFLLCVGPLNPTNQRIDAFFSYFDERLIESVYQFQSSHFGPQNKWTYKSKVYRLSVNDQGHLIPIEYYPPVQFHAAYELDVVNQARKQQSIEFPELHTHFEVVAPFDLGASVYDDVHPVLAVAHNLIVRGLPTKSTVFIEEAFKTAFGTNTRTVHYGEIQYKSEQELELQSLYDFYNASLDSISVIPENFELDAQIMLTPIAIARFQKVLIEAIITGHLDISKSNWKVLVQEEDVPFASLAIKDFEQLFTHLVALTEEFQDYELPEIELHVIASKQYLKSPLHPDKNVYLELPSYLKNETFDLVVTQSLLKTIGSAIDEFSKYKVHNNCYFNIRNCKRIRSERVIYTSSIIRYNNLVEKSTQGVFKEIDSAKEHLTYFLQLLFRKEAFRRGQLPILDRALQNLPVIGLLPTGGGKSLTYQIAALMQPGITMVIDPLKSLMKDQYDGLVNSGIDYCAFINSTLTSSEKKEKENQLESSQLLFVFLSPERLSIASFRERLKNMHEYNVYFSYGVIDEVHCVSEWGHDFRFSYLHLGRNLYNYVKSKEGVISLFGLTATASFDVLADVERELSGNGAFNLDADVIVRHENTNRLELQYKIEKVPVEFDEDRYYDSNHVMPQHLPRALNITWTKPQYESKGAFLESYISKIPGFINELQNADSIDNIKESFIERQNNDEGTNAELSIPMPDDFYQSQSVYEQAGIVFCPHVRNTGVAVMENSERLRTGLNVRVGSFSGSDDEDSSMKNLEDFRDNKLPLMIATKAFGMGIDKPNVRFTVNMNYSSSLEAFVQEAGRSGRDRKVAIASILVSDYKLAKVDRSAQIAYPAAVIKNKWFHAKDLEQILSEFNLNIPEEKILFASPDNDVVKLYCPKDNKMFGFNKCSNDCNAFDTCSLRKVLPETKGWKSELELLKELHAQNLQISKKNFQYLNADYQSVMYFFNESFKGDFIERKYMNKLLNTIKVRLSKDEFGELQSDSGFLKRLFASGVGERLIVKVPYGDDDYTDLSKAIYRMCCIELIEDFTQDYAKSEFRIVTVRKDIGGYYEGLRDFLLRYYTEDRANNELEKVYNIPLRNEEDAEVIKEIYRCLAYLTEFVYDKISEKRKRAIDDMRNFCIEGLNDQEDWLDLNESLKDFIFFYFNSKYAKSDYVADNGEPFSLVEDTDGGKKSSEIILKKFLRVIDDEVVGVGTPLDNVKHLYGAVRLISRSLTDTNPALALLEGFCLIYLGFKNNESLRIQFQTRYSEGMIEMAQRMEAQNSFWVLFKDYNELLEPYMRREKIIEIVEETTLLVHGRLLSDITTKYLEGYE